MFSKAKLKRFNENVGCAPPPTKYNTQLEKKITNIVIDKSGRFANDKENTPAPNAYMSMKIEPIKGTPRKKILSAPKLNLSACSSNSATSQTVFLNPSGAFIRSKSLRSKEQHDAKQSDLENKIKTLTSERDKLKINVSELEERMLSLKLDNVKISNTKELCESSTQVTEIKNLSSNDENNASTSNSVTVSMEEFQLMKDELEHLTLLRDNLEKSIAKKDDLIADLYNQVDLIVEEVQEHQDHSMFLKEEVDKLVYKLNQTCEDKNAVDFKVASMIAKYESIIKHHCNEHINYKDDIAKKDVKIELLNDSISILNTKLSELGNHMAKIPNLEMRIGDLSIESKEKEVIGTILQSELNEKLVEINKLEAEVEIIKNEKDELVASNSDGLLLLEDLQVELDELRVQAKESDVLQQFLEKEIASREAEITEYSLRIQSLESDFESTRHLAMDLQQDAEAQLNQIFCLKASMSAKEYDIEAKDDIIDALKEQMRNKFEGNHNESKNGQILKLEDELQGAKELMNSARENTTQLEEKLIKLLSEIGEHDELHKKRLLEKDSELEELSVKYSDALLEQESLKRVLAHSAEELENERMLMEVTEMELKMVKNEFRNKVDQNKLLEANIRDMTMNLTHLEDALACEEAESKEMQDTLEEKISQTEEAVKNAKEEFASVMSSNSGFMSQITQLRIDMQKKCCAVDQMQGCIDALRQEKNEVNSSYDEMRNSFNDKETLLTDLQNEFESKLKTITELQDQVDKNDGELLDKDECIHDLKCQVVNMTLEKEESERTFNSRIEDAKLRWMKEQRLRVALEAKAEEIQDDLNSLREEKNSVINDMSSNLVEKEAKISQLEQNLRDLESKYEGYDDQIKNLQISLTEKSLEIDGFERNHNEINLAVECQQESSFQLKNHLKKLEDDQGFLNHSLQEKDNLLSHLNHSILLKSDEIQELQKDIDRKENKIRSLEDSLIIIKEQLKSNISERESNNEKVVQIGNILIEKENNEASLVNKMDQLSEELFNLRVEQSIKETDIREISDSLQEEVEFWKNKFEYLQKMIEPFKDQLNAYDLERATLLSESSAAQKEVDSLSREYAKLLGHTNHKQKIQHVAKIKEENNQLKKEVLKLRHDIDTLRHSHRKLEESTGARQKTHFNNSNKENCGRNMQESVPVLSPLRGSNKINRI